MTRILSRDDKLLFFCDQGSSLFSTCKKRQYMAIITDEHGFILSTGYNGSAKGQPHCIEGGCPRAEQGSASGSNYDNCFTGDTEFLTRDGVRNLKEMLGKDIEVLTSSGWKSATVDYFGRQKVYNVRMHRYGERKTVRATANHRWFTYDSHRKRHERTTDQLIAGHVLASAYARSTPAFSTEGIKAGLVFGDGSCNYHQPGSGSFIELHGPATSLSNMFEGEGPVYRGLPRNWKVSPAPLDESHEYLWGWLAGYFAADGTMSHSTPRLDSVSLENLEHAVEVCYLLGIPTLGITNTFRRVEDGVYKTGYIYSLSIPQGALPEEFFLLDHHREKAQGRERKRGMPRWIIDEVTPVHDEEDVYCAVVPDGQEFTLTGNILTGNCIAIHAEQNALLHADYSSIKHGATLYVNGPPCFTCAKLIANSGINRLVCFDDEAYVQWPEIKIFLVSSGIDVYENQRKKFFDGI